MEAIPQVATAPWPPEHRPVLIRYFAYRAAISAETTVRRLRGVILRWSLFLASRGVRLEEASPVDVADFMATWPWSAGTKRQAVSDLRGLHQWMLEQGITTGNPWRGIKGPRKPRRIPRVLADDEITALESAMRRPTVRDLRDHALISFLRATGCRFCEAQRLRMQDLDLEHGQAVVLGKGNRERTVYLDRSAVLALDAWLRFGRRVWAPSPSGPVFVGRHGKAINRTVARDALIRAAQRAGLGRHVHPHLLRHSAATRWLERGANLREVQELLGHTDLSSTQVYLHVAPTRLREVYRRVQGG